MFSIFINCPKQLILSLGGDGFNIKPPLKNLIDKCSHTNAPNFSKTLKNGAPLAMCRTAGCLGRNPRSQAASTMF